MAKVKETTPKETVNYKFTEAASEALWDTRNPFAQCDNCGLMMTVEEAHAPGEGVWCDECVAEKGDKFLKEIGT